MKEKNNIISEPLNKTTIVCNSSGFENKFTKIGQHSVANLKHINDIQQQEKFFKKL